MALSATLQFRTTLDQAGRVAGLAGELEIAESEVLRLLLDRALEGPARTLLRELRAELAEQRERIERQIEEHERQRA
jgi:hypothetical protein